MAYSGSRRARPRGVTPVACPGVDDRPPRLGISVFGPLGDAWGYVRTMQPPAAGAAPGITAGYRPTGPVRESAGRLRTLIGSKIQSLSELCETLRRRFIEEVNLEKRGRERAYAVHVLIRCGAQFAV